MNKRGQFYLVAAIIIIGVVFGFFATRNYVRSVGEDVKIYHLSNELKEEGVRVIDYGILNDEEKMQEFMDEVAEDYLKEKAQDVFFVYGDENNIEEYRYEEEIIGKINTKGGIGTNIRKKKKTVNTLSIFSKAGKNNVEVEINGKGYPFSLNSGENFFLVLKKEAEDERYIEIR